MVKTVLITGNSRGLGKALTNKFKAEGYSVLGCNSKSHDLNNPDHVRMLVRAAIDAHVSILINNAGVYFNKPLVSTIEQERSRVMNINFIAPVTLTKMLWETLSQNKGTIININSIADRQGAPGETMYAASKHALRGFFSSLQFEATKAEISITDVFLGAMRTDMTKGRSDREKLMSVSEVAEQIFDLCNHKKSTRVTEIDIHRRIY